MHFVWQSLLVKETAQTKDMVWSRTVCICSACAGVSCDKPSPQRVTRAMGSWTVDSMHNSSALRVPAAASPKFFGTEDSHKGVSMSWMTSQMCFMVATSASFGGGGADGVKGKCACYYKGFWVSAWQWAREENSHPFGQHVRIISFHVSGFRMISNGYMGLQTNLRAESFWFTSLAVKDSRPPSPLIRLTSWEWIAEMSLIVFLSGCSWATIFSSGIMNGWLKAV